jgi:hypothetical protein
VSNNEQREGTPTPPKEHSVFTKEWHSERV